MAVLISLGGSSSGDGFPIAPHLGTTYEAEIALRTDSRNSSRHAAEFVPPGCKGARHL